MTITDHPTDMMDNPDGRDYQYRFAWMNEEAWDKLKTAILVGRMVEMHPKSMEHLRTRIDHVTFKTYDKMGYVKGMKKHAVSPSWKKVPHTQGKMEVNNANGGGSRVKVNGYHTGENWGKVDVEFHVEYTPSEIIDAYENGVNESAITDSINEARRWAVDDRLDELQAELMEAQKACDHKHVLEDESSYAPAAYCEDCQKEWHNSLEWNFDLQQGNVTVVGTA